MSRKDKLLKRFLSEPKDFSWDELTSLLLMLGFEEVQTGKTGGSRRRFKKDEVIISLHKPHPKNILKQYQIKQVLEILKNEDLL